MSLKRRYRGDREKGDGEGRNERHEKGGERGGYAVARRNRGNTSRRGYKVTMAAAFVDCDRR